MRVNGIIAEYNPFHNGHQYQLEESLRLSEADYTIVLMSGDFVQRGTPAAVDKYIRAEMALRCGADMVLELPVQYATSSAETFAAGAVALLDRLGVVTHLCFGSEHGNVELLKEMALLLSNEQPRYQSALKSFLHCGYTYPAARVEALTQCYPFLAKHRDILASPNNILGIEYCKALIRRRSAILPLAVKRRGAGYHDSLTSSRFCSAFAIRQALYAGADISQLLRNLPPDAARPLTQYLSRYFPMHPDIFSSALFYKLLAEKSVGYEKYSDVTTDLSNRIVKLLGSYTSYTKFCEILKTKDMTYTRISRCLLHILLNITQEHMILGKEMDYAPYIRVLGFRKSAVSLFGAIKTHTSVPIITKLADAQKSLEGNALRLLQQDIFCSELYRGTTAAQSDTTALSEYSVPLVII